MQPVAIELQRERLVVLVVDDSMIWIIAGLQLPSVLFQRLHRLTAWHSDDQVKRLRPHPRRLVGRRKGRGQEQSQKRDHAAPCVVADALSCGSHPTTAFPVPITVQ